MLTGEDGVRQMEYMMREKLQQRTKAGPFQLRKTFKYFDRDGSGGIDEFEFESVKEAVFVVKLVGTKAKLNCHAVTTLSLSQSLLLFASDAS